MKDDEIRGLLHEMRDEPVPEESLERVRRRIAERTRPRLRMLWRGAAALAAAACLLLLVRWFEEPILPPAPPRAVIAQTPPPLPEPAAQPVAKRQQRIERKPTVAVDVVIRIETPDPDVVILLIGD